MNVWAGIWLLDASRGKTLSEHDNVSRTHCVAPVGVEPALGTRPHVTVLHIDGPQVHVALLVWNKVSQVADAAHLSRPLAMATWN